jgi:capsule polysaccharide export protein KpsC/LpsZ
MKPVKLSLKHRLLKNHAFRLMYELWRRDVRGSALKRYKQRVAFERNLQKYAHTEVPMDVPFVYFGLHLQPEKTSSNFGGIYCDQLLALERMAAVLPAGWKIYAKENPKQGYFMRTDSFFKRLSSIPKVVYIHPSVNTYTLMRHSKLTATITGTLGFESICGGKPCVYFGWGTWYKTFPGAFPFELSINLEEIAAYSIPREALEKSVHQLAEKTGRGTIYLDWKSRQHVEEENYTLLKNSIREILSAI